MKRFIATALVVAFTGTAAQAAEFTPVQGGTASASFASSGPFEQSFVADAGLLTNFAFTFATTNRATTTGSVTFSLFAQNGDTALASQTTNLSGLTFRTLGGFVDVFAGSVALTAGTTYRAVLSSDSSSLALGYNNVGDAYVLGALTRRTNSDAACVAGSNRCDANFRYSVQPVAAVPEPASWALMLTGFALVGGAARYRRRAAVLRYS